jgi:hypothetical protein
MRDPVRRVFVSDLANRWLEHCYIELLTTLSSLCSATTAARLFDRLIHAVQKRDASVITQWNEAPYMDFELSFWTANHWSCPLRELDHWLQNNPAFVRLFREFERRAFRVAPYIECKGACYQEDFEPFLGRRGFLPDWEAFRQMLLELEARFLSDTVRDDAYFSENFEIIMVVTKLYGLKLFRWLSCAIRNEPIELLKRSETATLAFWEDMSWRFSNERDEFLAIPLKHWRDEAAWEFIRVVTGDRMTSITYRRRRRALGLIPPREAGIPAKVDDFTPAMERRVRAAMAVA